MPKTRKLTTKTQARVLAKQYGIKPRSPKEYAYLFAERVNEHITHAYRYTELKWSDDPANPWHALYRMHVAAEGMVWAWRTCRLAIEVEQWLGRLNREDYLRVVRDVAERADAIGFVPYILNSHPAIIEPILDSRPERLPEHILVDYHRYWNS